MAFVTGAGDASLGEWRDAPSGPRDGASTAGCAAVRWVTMRHDAPRIADLYRNDLDRHLFVPRPTDLGISNLSARVVRWLRAAAQLVIW